MANPVDDEDCQFCDSFTEFQISSKKIGANDLLFYREEPPTAKQFGNISWSFLHTMAAYYPLNPTPANKQAMRDLLNSVGNLFPCKPCATDFTNYIHENKPNVNSREEISLWLCDAHNMVNKKLGKPVFDCQFWSARWKEGWASYLNNKGK